MPWAHKYMGTSYCFIDWCEFYFVLCCCFDVCHCWNPPWVSLRESQIEIFKNKTRRKKNFSMPNHKTLSKTQTTMLFTVLLSVYMRDQKLPASGSSDPWGWVTSEMVNWNIFWKVSWCCKSTGIWLGTFWFMSRKQN